MNRWEPPVDWLRIRTVDSHTAGEPFRVILSGVPEPQGSTMLERRRFARRHLDALRRVLVWEPRGHADMYGGLLTSPVSPEADIGVIFLHNEGFSTMCGHGVIALTTVAVETGLVPRQEPQTVVRLDTPAGLVIATADIARGRVQGVSFRNVPSWVVTLDAEVEVPELGRVGYDLAFGGAVYAVVEAASLGLRCLPKDVSELVRIGTAIKQAIMSRGGIEHPAEPDLGFLYGVIFVCESDTPGVHSRNVCVFADGEVDRSPTGTGVSARLAIHHARGQVEVGETIEIESIIGSCFAGKVVEVTRFGRHEAIIPEVSGRAFITGRHEFLVDPEDEIGRGFFLR